MDGGRLAGVRRTWRSAWFSLLEGESATNFSLHQGELCQAVQQTHCSRGAAEPRSLEAGASRIGVHGQLGSHSDLEGSGTRVRGKKTGSSTVERILETTHRRQDVVERRRFVHEHGSAHRPIILTPRTQILLRREHLNCTGPQGGGESGPSNRRRQRRSLGESHRPMRGPGVHPERVERGPSDSVDGAGVRWCDRPHCRARGVSVLESRAR